LFLIFFFFFFFYCSVVLRVRFHCNNWRDYRIRVNAKTNGIVSVDNSAKQTDRDREGTSRRLTAQFDALSNRRSQLTQTASILTVRRRHVSSRAQSVCFALVKAVAVLPFTFTVERSNSLSHAASSRGHSTIIVSNEVDFPEVSDAELVSATSLCDRCHSVNK